MKDIRVEKRLPFGFVGLWGKVYKKFGFNINVSDKITYQSTNYVAMQDLVQFKEANIRNISFSQGLQNLATRSDYKLFETTDSYFNDESKNFECVVNIGDIINISEEYWVVEKIEEKCIFTPKKQSFYYCAIKRVSENIK